MAALLERLRVARDTLAAVTPQRVEPGFADLFGEGTACSPQACRQSGGAREGDPASLADGQGLPAGD